MVKKDEITKDRIFNIYHTTDGCRVRADNKLTNTFKINNDLKQEDLIATPILVGSAEINTELLTMKIPKLLLATKILLETW